MKLSRESLSGEREEATLHNRGGSTAEGEYSYKDYSGQSLKDSKATILSDTKETRIPLDVWVSSFCLVNLLVFEALCNYQIIDSASATAISVKLYGSVLFSLILLWFCGIPIFNRA
ncbi:MAG: hypothetical protein D6808_08175, partial [Candidatus Dadabacteria bacterium]